MQRYKTNCSASGTLSETPVFRELRHPNPTIGSAPGPRLGLALALIPLIRPLLFFWLRHRPYVQLSACVRRLVIVRRWIVACVMHAGI